MNICWMIANNQFCLVALFLISFGFLNCYVDSSDSFNVVVANLNSSDKSSSSPLLSNDLPNNHVNQQIVRGYPCVKKSNQLYCGSPGHIYPRKSINNYIEENKALIRRMFGENLPPTIVDQQQLVNDKNGDKKIRVPRSVDHFISRHLWIRIVDD